MSSPRRRPTKFRRIQWPGANDAMKVPSAQCRVPRGLLRTRHSALGTSAIAFLLAGVLSTPPLAHVTKTGTFFNATGSMEPAMYFTGEKLEKISDDTYRLTDGVLTSCDLDSPSWSLDVARADVTVNDYAHMQDVTFRIHRLPLLWMPR